MRRSRFVVSRAVIGIVESGEQMFLESAQAF
jgi:hypothetical protein